MSAIVNFRNNIIEAIKAAAPEMQNVDWYDGLFDEKDIADWTLKTPCARVAVMNVPTEHHSTGELNACLRVVVVIIDENRYVQLDGDANAWDLVEKIAIMANLNTFGDPNAAPATKVIFKRISQPELRREGIAVGIVEWTSDLMIGRNRSVERSYFFLNGERINKVPRSHVTALGQINLASGAHAEETLDITPED
ncbi:MULTISPECIES: hypothetical protein [Bradyrhizobium]|uniref:Uncharacterized protein n=1 Tax=Bradyrhizobium diazoefficiens TaxID=1355477 RepID=A0A809X4V7_9BRAD|nr:hypothetical protein [Bradyrhizobium elkanii]BCE22190.1 hypothetical protein XF1B_48710 [Bradyrhizobium diazoefficiens]WLA52682.1 hypothetical protein QIH80_22985 [Bradyrhizobium elkanii]WLB77029.1 hypothetical protein QIH83_21680 [Bradyrhizobium elkanii]BCE48455.1 hypothetical protein XF4B_48040 [Bradyrhizobium diazoefficiens]BCE91971.1 hypothetical protein XF10B_47690 [Bradyrhizobium diazoefficiens]